MGRLLDDPAMAGLIELYGRRFVRVQAEHELERLRQRLSESSAGALDDGEWERELARLPDRIGLGLESELEGRLRRVLNATGVFLHTNLGRSPLPRTVAEGLPRCLDAYCDLEFDLSVGERSSRNRRAEALIRQLTGAERALVVNNNAAALVLALSALAAGREVVVSRGELVEIGGSFRIPSILEAASARLVEVGTTNRTRLEDYENALGRDTALLLKVFPSNYRLTGFVEQVAPAALVALARREGLPLLVDEGSGLLRPSSAPQLRDHSSMAELLEAGCDLVSGSADKLLGGPQAGILVGRRSLLDRCHRQPLYRAFRPDRTTLAALEGVLRLHLRGGPLPLDRLWVEPDEHRRRLERMAAILGAEIITADAYIGGGSAPEAPIAGEALALPGAEGLAECLRTGDPPVVGYTRGGCLVLDLRTVDPRDDEELERAVERAVEVWKRGR